MKSKSARKFLVVSPLIFLLPFLFHQKQKPDSPPPPSALLPQTSDPCNTFNTTFLSGEELTYKVYYNWNFVWIAAADITFRVIDDDDQYHFQVVGETYESYDWFFKVRDYYDTWVQKDNLLPVMSIRNVLEGKYRLYDYLVFEQSRRLAHNERGKAKDDIRERKSFPIESCMHDMLSILYYARCIDFSKHKSGQNFPIKIFADKETWSLNVKYKGSVPAFKVKGQGEFNALKFTPEVIVGEVFPEGAELNVWISDDGNHLPLVIESPLSVGSAKAVLKSYKGLRYPLKAKLQ